MVLRPMTSRNLISHVCRTRRFIMAILHSKQGLLCDKSKPVFIRYCRPGKVFLKSYTFTPFQTTKSSTTPNLRPFAGDRLFADYQLFCVFHNAFRSNLPQYRLTFYKTTNLRLAQIESICRQKIKCYSRH